jgi:phenylalanyl-tRNA synthetase alpha chain
MGFQEMDGGLVQPAFWNMDALFVPQDHPARDVQDTFYLAHPPRTTIPKAVFERVKQSHETGGNGSKGWRYGFSKDESEKLLLRTHTTVLSALTLAKIKEGKLPIPGKYFAIGKNFRNEALDWKHLFEFNQVEGIVVDPNVTFAQLLGYLKVFFAKMGYPDIRIRPHHFPYTEPSVEIDVWHEGKKEWVELGGAGVFRPELVRALLGEDIPVLAWGPGFDRIILEFFKVTDMRDLYKNDIKQLREARRFLLEER